MVDEHRDMGGWGVYSIFKEAGRLLYQHFRIFRPFILAFVLPLALIQCLELIGVVWLLAWAVEQGQQLLNLGSIFGHHGHGGFYAFHAAFSKAQYSVNPIFKLLVLVYVLTFLIFIISWLFVSLATVAIAKVIHYIYSSNDTTSLNEDRNSSQTQILTQSIFTSLPHSLYQIFIISLCFFVIDILTYFFLTLPFYLLSRPWFAPELNLQLLYNLVWNLVFLILNFWFLVSIQVTVLESQYYGWSTLQQSAKLMKAKAMTALGLLGVYFVYFCILNWILFLAIAIPAHSIMLYVVAGTFAMGYLAFGSLWLVVATVFYFVSKNKCSGGGEEGHQVDRDLYQALDVSVEN